MARTVYIGDQYRMIEKISREGNMATIYRCKDDFDNVQKIPEKPMTEEVGLPETCGGLPDELSGILDFIS